MSSYKTKKTIIFFDGDGTIWYPQETKRKKPPYWIYGDTNSKEVKTDYLKHLSLSKTSLPTLKKLKQMGVYLVLLSTHPHHPKDAKAVLNTKVEYLKIKELFDEIHPTSGSPLDKGEKMLTILKKLNLSRADALMVGDSYKYDYFSSKKAGVESLILRSAYLKKESYIKKNGKLINEIEDVLMFLN